MKSYRLSIPVQVCYGRNIWKEAIYTQQDYFKGVVLIVTTGRSLIRLGYLDALKQSIQSLPHVSEVLMFDQISADPKLSEVEACSVFAQENHADVVIGFGGGSALDAAKAVAVGAGHQEKIEEFFYNREIPTEKTLPIIAIPTTAGTGSELSKAAILTDENRKIKNGIRGAALYPSLAIVDSVFTETVPTNITAETGFDVLAHAIESYVSKAASPYTEMLSEYAIALVGKYLPRLMADLKDQEAREKMSFASMIMGINLGNASTCLAHRLQYPLGAHTGIGHGKGLAALFPAWLSLEYSYSSEKLNRVMQLLEGIDCRNKSDMLQWGMKFMKNLRLPTTLREIGVTENLIGDMVGEVSGSIGNDPAAREPDIIEKIYRAAL